MSASLSLFEQEHAAREKYIYFICGVSGALVAYLGKDFKPTHPWTTQASLMVATLSCLVGSFLFGIGRIIFYIEGLSTNREALTAREETANLVDALTTTPFWEFSICFSAEAVASCADFDKQKDWRALHHRTNSNRHSHVARMKRWFKISTVFLVLCHVFLIAGFILMILAKSII